MSVVHNPIDDQTADSGASTAASEFGGALTVEMMGTSEHLVIWAIRQWVSDHKNRVPEHTLIQNGFAAAYVDTAFGPFDTLMTLSATTATRVLDVRCLKCKGVGDGEVDILSVISLIQAGRGDLACIRLGSWLPPAAVRHGLSAADRLARVLERGGHTIWLRAEYVMPTEETLSDKRPSEVLPRVPATLQ